MNTGVLDQFGNVSYGNGTTSTQTDSADNMPVAQDWRMTPWAAADQLFASKCSGGDDGAAQRVNPSWEGDMRRFFRAKLGSDCAAWDALALPSLNEIPAHRLVDGQVVRFRCMVQDMFDPEYYLSVFAVRDLSTGRTRLATGRYRDVAPVGPREEALLDNGATVHAERQSIYCVSVPGETPWVREEHRRRSEAQQGSAAAAAQAGASKQQNRLKRNHDEDEDDMETAENDSKAANGGGESMETGTSEVAADSKEDSKKAKTGSGKAVNTGERRPAPGAPLSLNLPIESPHGKACIVKVYEHEDERDMANGNAHPAGGIKKAFSVNEVVEFVGIVSLDPSLATDTDGTTADLEMAAVSAAAQFEKQERLAKSPPPSLVPRLHALVHRRLPHSHPSLPAELPQHSASLQEDAARCRAELHSLLTKILIGDSLAADYLICHLVSRIYLRRDVLTLGKFSVNLFNVPLNENYAKRLATIVQLLVDKAHYLPLTVDNFNKLNFVPKKDYEANRLVSGALQLSAGTHLVLDETAMGAGQLSPHGLKNLTSLGSLISWQRLEYDFQYHQLEFPSDVPCLVVSEGRSMLPSDCQVMLRPSEPVGPNVVRERFAEAGAALDAALLSRLREYLCVIRRLEFEMTDEAQKAVQEDFVYERQRQQQQEGGGAADQQGGDGNNRGGGLTAEGLHHMLVTARLLSLSEGKKTLTAETWQRVKAMEKERADRMAHLPVRQQQN